MSRKKFENKTTRIFVPDDFEPLDYGGIIAQNRINVLMFLDFLNWKPMIGKADRAAPLFITVERLAELFGRKNLVKPLRDALVAEGIIECDYTYCPVGNSPKAFGYRLGPVVRDLVYRPYFIQDQRALKRLKAFRQSAFKVSADEAKPEPPVYEYIRDCISRLSVREGFEEIINEAEWKVLRKRRRKKNSRFPHVKLGIPEIKAQAISTLYVLDGNDEHKRQLISDKQGRVYHLMTNLNRQARGLLQLDGEDLYEIDLSNSQLYLMAMLALEIYQSERRAVKKYIESTENTNIQRERLETYCNEYHSVPQDLIQFVQDTSNGIIYEKILKVVSGSDRAKIKYETIVGLMATTKRALTIAPYRAIRSLYPTVAFIIEECKRQYGHKWIGRTLQSMESSVMIESVCERIRTEHDGLAVIPLHDCLFTVEENIDIVHQIIIEEFQKRFTWTPTAKPKKVKSIPPTLDRPPQIAPDSIEEVPPF